MSIPDAKDVPGMSRPALLSALNDCQNEWEGSSGKPTTDILRIIGTHALIMKELRGRGMTELGIETFIRTLPNWPGGR